MIQKFTEFTLNESIEDLWCVISLKGNYVTVVSKPGTYDSLALAAKNQNPPRGEWIAAAQVKDVKSQKNVIGLEY